VFFLLQHQNTYFWPQKDINLAMARIVGPGGQNYVIVTSSTFISGFLYQ